MSEQTVTLLYVAAAIATVALVMGGLFKALRRLRNGTVGARQVQRRLINRLFPERTCNMSTQSWGPQR
jgi:hypothetical protein